MRLILSLAVLSAVPVGIAARAAEMVPPPLVYPADTWQGRSVATVRVLDGLDSHVQSLTIPVGQDVTYRALTIHVGACRDRPATLVPDSAGWLTIRDTRQDGRGFDGWMLAGEPFLGVFQDPVYTVQIVSCTGDIVAPIPPPLTVAATAAGQGAQAAPGVQVQGAQTQGVQIQSTQVQGAQAGNPPGAPTPQGPGAAPAPAPASPPQMSGAPLSLSPPPDEQAPASGAPPVVAGTGLPVPTVAPSAIAGQHGALPPPVPYGAAGGGGGPLPLGPPALPPPVPPTSAAPPPGASSATSQPGQPQSLLPP
ncbi:conserved hypothetical protein [Gluconacetobacter diazotrophicus PA1 5]|uniref:DUF2155 domain-containing protein n=1 Tax=Gluconacetobacter diazotrophicus TaxID=33996 RepID=UPI000173CCE5|nr:DUF2155 domain-containing protein [Gluconacetobacter diazotrophicus]ACI50891.1 conserved hypothetical protein [Gluconacetobacter diazotrophicus PA1 5]TWB08655.1 hypothetical protein FBZ86_106153 [Gluconacetobacter diazotrophicus]